MDKRKWQATANAADEPPSLTTIEFEPPEW